MIIDLGYRRLVRPILFRAYAGDAERVHEQSRTDVDLEDQLSGPIACDDRARIVELTGRGADRVVEARADLPATWGRPLGCGAAPTTHFG